MIFQPEISVLAMKIHIKETQIHVVDNWIENHGKYNDYRWKYQRPAENLFPLPQCKPAGKGCFCLYHNGS